MNQRTLWQKLRRRRPAMVALYIIGIACLLAIFAYPLSPDSSPNATRMLQELRAKPSGFSRQFVMVPRRPAVPQKPFLARLFSGSEPSYKLIPINDFFFARDTLIVAHYIAYGMQDTLAFPLQNLQALSSNLQPLGRQQQQVRQHNITRHTFLLGTDSYGRDILSRLIIGTRISIGVGLIAGLLSLTIGILLGSLAGYYRGWVHDVLMYLINVLTAIPNLLLVFAITLSIGRGIWQIFLAIGLTMWVGTARLIREQVMELRNAEYIQAARIIGLSNTRIITRHILPNMAGPLMAIAASNFAAAIVMEAGLSFLGIGVQPPTPSWGLMIREHLNLLLTNRPASVLIPGLAIVILACAFNILGNALCEVMDNRDKG